MATPVLSEYSYEIHWIYLSTKYINRLTKFTLNATIISILYYMWNFYIENFTLQNKFMYNIAFIKGINEYCSDKNNNNYINIDYIHK